MNGKNQAADHQRNAQEYLEQTRHGYIIDPSSGLYHPYTTEREDEIEENATEAQQFPGPLRISVDKEFMDYVPIGVGVFALLLSALTLILLFGTVIYARKQWVETKRTADQSVIAATAATEAANTSKEALTSAERAFVSFSHITSQVENVHTESAEVQQIKFTMIWENSGTTPAIATIHRTGKRIFAVDGHPIPNEKAFPEEKEFIGDTSVFAPLVLGPRSQVAPAPLNVSVQDEFGIARLPVTKEVQHQRKGLLVLWGWVAYRDIFTGTKPHISEFCEFIDAVEIFDDKPLEPQFHYSPCGEHNCTDEYCKDYKQVLRAISYK